jgi:hypothetical protein
MLRPAVILRVRDVPECCYSKTKARIHCLTTAEPALLLLKPVWQMLCKKNQKLT